MSLIDKIELFDEVFAATKEMLPAEISRRYQAVRQNAAGRMDAGMETTIVAFLGATGSGKSSLFNAVAGSEIASASARRPTTTSPLAAVAEGADADRVLDWLGVAERAVVRDPNFPPNTVLLDLPDVDSYAIEHRQITAEFAKKVDVLVWVVDPQKYADASLHQGFVRSFAAHAGITRTVMTHIDQVPVAEQARLLAHCKQVFASDGVDTTVLGVSALSGEGIDRLRQTVSSMAEEKQAAWQRLEADLDSIRAELAKEVGTGKVGAPVADRDLTGVSDAAFRSSGAQTVAQAVGKSYKHRAGLWTGWPVISWVRRLRPDPLRRLRINAGNKVIGHTSLPAAPAITSSDLARSVRQVGANKTRSLPAAYRSDMSATVAEILPTLADPLDSALGKAQLDERRVPLWWRMVAFLQLIFAGVAVAGLGWLAVNFVLHFLAIEVSPPTWQGLPIPLELLVGGLLAGALTALVSSLFVMNGAARATRRAERKLRKAIGTQLRIALAEPINERLSAYQGLQKLLSA